MLYKKGLRNKNGKKVTINGLSTILHNPFYMGMIRIEKTGEIFVGKHKPVVSKELFDAVQAVFEGKNIPKTERHFFVFRRRIFCTRCRNFYIAERQKGEIYYRCHTRNCTKGTVREDSIDKEILKVLKPLGLNELEYHFFKQETLKRSESGEAEYEIERQRLQLLLEQSAERLSKLADAYVDEIFDKETYIGKKNKILLEEKELKERLNNLKAYSDAATRKLETFLELVNSAYITYKSGSPEKKQETVKTVFSNCEIDGKNILVKPEYPFQLMAERRPFTSGSPCREAAQTLEKLYEKLFSYFKALDISKSSNHFTNYSISKRRKKYRYNSSRFNNLGLNP